MGAARTMRTFEQDLQQIKDKAYLHEWIDGLNWDDPQIKLLILVEQKDSSVFNVLGNPSHERMLWMLEEFKHYLMFGHEHDDERD